VDGGRAKGVGERVGPDELDCGLDAVRGEGVKVVAGARDVNATIAAANRADFDRVASGGSRTSAAGWSGAPGPVPWCASRATRGGVAL
jgi:hypothetical protein